MDQLLSSLEALVCVEIWFLSFLLVTNGKKSWKIGREEFRTMEAFGAVAAIQCFFQLTNLENTFSIIIVSVRCSGTILRMTTQNPSQNIVTSVKDVLEPLGS